MFIITVHAQTAPFTLKGTVDVDTGTIYLIPGLNSIYYPTDFELKTTINNGKFTFSGSIPYPLPVIITIKEGGKMKYWSKRFLIDKGNQNMNWKVQPKQSTYVSIDNESSKQQDSYNSFLLDNDRELHQSLVAINGLGADTSMETRAQLTKQKEKLMREREELIIDYTTQHPLSFIPLWEMVFALDKGYTPFLDTFYSILSPKLKSTHTGKQYAAGVSKLRTTAIGRVFPKMQALDIDGKDATIKISYKYTFVDFWFSGCYPCIRLFPDFRKLYETYHSKGFEFVAISTDEGEQVNNWKLLVNEKSLPWPQYLDKNKSIVNALLIERYPTSFLLDEKGKILARDLLPEELEKFLEEHLQ
jgi:thiol-disulfide isomerase/thioredoxin